MTANRHIIHVDMDAFYASVEVLDNPDLAGKALIVGGDPKARGVVSAASYEARRFGIHSAMPMTQALRLCPNVIVMPVRMDRYAELSRKIHTIFGRFTPLIEPVSIDEAFLDVTGVPLDHIEIGHRIKNQIKTEISLTASVGIAPNKFLAKVASDLKKPDGFVIITEENKQQILDPLPVRVIYGVGKVTQQTLQSHGIETVAQLRAQPLAALRTIVGNFADELLDLTNGIDDRPVEPPSAPRSISSEHTFPKNVADPQTLLSVLYEQVQRVARQLRDDNLEARTVHLKFRYGDFRTITRAKTLDSLTATTDTLFKAAKEIFETWQAAEAAPIRLLGFCATNLAETNQRQLLLFSDPADEKQKRIDNVLDAIERRYGKDAVRRKI